MFNKRAFTTLQYALMLVVAVAAILALQVMLRRAISAKWKESADTLGGGRQYERGVTTITVN